MTTLFEGILYGTADSIGDPDAVFIWLSDSPELNAQTTLKIESKSDKIRVHDMVTIDAAFNTEYFEGGHIYFLNTQKLGTDKLLTGTSDKRQYSIWETLTNTAQRNPTHFYVVIDEAHRGTNTSVQAQNKAQSIMQKFVKGSPEDGLCVMPLVIGVTATPQRFDTLIAGTSSTVQKVIVPPDHVRESGLLKDRIIIHYPDMPLTANMTMLKGAVENWQNKCAHWQSYCERENERQVNPVLVVQVEASRIEENTSIRVVFFKMNLSTGWDCPRAETMMSFRSAQDYTYIAQLLGRMIRTPLARRIKSDAELNSVSLFLPYFNEETVTDVIHALCDNEAVMPTETGTSKELATLNRNLSYSDVFDTMDGLVTYRIDSLRKQAPLKLLMQISRALTMDGIDFKAQRNIKNAVVSKIAEEIKRLKESGEFGTKAQALTGFSLGTLTFDYGDNAYSYDENTQTMAVTEFDISRHFEQAGKILGEGLHTEYWIKNSNRDHVDVKIEIIVVAGNTDAMENLNAYAEQTFLSLHLLIIPFYLHP